MLEKRILEIMSLLDISFASGLISEMNVSILKNEFKSFVDSISNLIRSIDLKNSGFVRDVLSSRNEIALVSDSSKTLENINNGPTMINRRTEETTPSFLKDNNKRQSRRGVRTESIIDFVRTHPGVSIKDITPNIKGCGEKTIQRELVELIREGKIRKTGDRRWSKYSIA